MKVLFRTDASLDIGTGHVIRCLTLANALRDLGHESVFVCRDHIGNLAERIERNNFRVHLLCHNPVEAKIRSLRNPKYYAWLGNDWEEDAKQTIAFACESFDLLVVDHYAIDSRWERRLRQSVKKIMVIDDLADRKHECDYILDQNLVRNMYDRYDSKIPLNCLKMYGPTYALLHPDYSMLHDQIPERSGLIKRIFISFGGADQFGLTELALKACLSLGCEIDVVVNPKNKIYETVAKIADKNINITLHGELHSLASLMIRADLAIGASGTTAWERCCLGLPTIVISMAENQVPIAEELNRQGYIQWLGRKDEVTENQLRQTVKELVESGLDARWSERCKGLVDGLGASRVCEILCSDPHPKYVVRKLSWSERHRINHVRQDTEFINWLRNSIVDYNDNRIFAVETTNRSLIAVAIFSKYKASWELALYPSPMLSRLMIRPSIVKECLRYMRTITKGALSLNAGWSKNDVPLLEPGIRKPLIPNRLRIGICTDERSWINDHIPEFVYWVLLSGHSVFWAHNAEELPETNLCFYLSYSRIVDDRIRSRHDHNLVVHESNLPEGRGWSPMSWQILKGASAITVTLFEAVDEVDAGDIYLQYTISMCGHELRSCWQFLQAKTTFRLCQDFIEKYPDIISLGRVQRGNATSYPRRSPRDSELNPDLSIREQFNLLRIVDNESYPAFFMLNDKKYILKIYSER